MADDPTVNETLFDLNTRHQVNLQRFTAGELRRLVPILNRAEADTVARLSTRTADAAMQGNFGTKRLQALFDSLQGINQRAYEQMYAQHRDSMYDLSREEARFQKKSITRATPVAVDMVTPDSATLRAVVTSRPFQGRYLRDWFRSLSGGAQRRLVDAIQVGMTNGETTDQIIRRVRGTRANNYKDGVLSTNRRTAERVVRTSVNHTANAARTEVYRANPELVPRVRYVATLDTRTSPVCQGLDGRVFSVNSGPRPPQHPNCRSTTTPIVASWRELGIDLDEAPAGTRASMNGQVPADMTYNEWLKGQSAAVQDEALGPTRGKLFRDGDLSVDRFTDTRGNEINLDTLRKTDEDAFSKAGIE